MRLLDPNPRTRLSAAEALKHPWLLASTAADGSGVTEKFPEHIIHPWLRAALGHQSKLSDDNPWSEHP